jgi:hypothetical protein
MTRDGFVILAMGFNGKQETRQPCFLSFEVRDFLRFFLVQKTIYKSNDVYYILTKVEIGGWGD